jgi:hypothetical protein
MYGSAIKTLLLIGAFGARKDNSGSKGGGKFDQCQYNCQNPGLSYGLCLQADFDH